MSAASMASATLPTTSGNQVRRYVSFRSQADEEMETELSRLKRMYADMALENHALKDLIEKKL
jgi:hypothetical protein